MKTTLRLLPIAALTAVLFGCGGGNSSSPPSGAASNFAAGSLLVSRSTYDPANTVSGTLPFNATPEAANTAPVTAVTPGTFPNVFTNLVNDANFGVTSEVLMDQWAPGATSPAKTLDITALAAKSQVNFATSFSSKSELALNVSLDQKSVTFVAYNSPIDQLDISNSNTPGVVDPTNNDIATPTFRTVAQLNFADSSLSFTNTNAFSGDNGRAAVLANGMYYLVGNAGDSGKTPKPTTALLDMLTMDTGVQSIVPGSSCAFTQVIGAFQSSSGGSYTPAPSGTPCSLATMGTISGGNSTGDQFGFSITALGQPADKTGKDDNFRGLFVGPDGTTYITKGSGSNGVNTVIRSAPQVRWPTAGCCRRLLRSRSFPASPRHWRPTRCPRRLPARSFLSASGFRRRIHRSCSLLTKVTARRAIKRPAAAACGCTRTRAARGCLWRI
jgi:hypothetical protein